MVTRFLGNHKQVIITNNLIISDNVEAIKLCKNMHI